MRTTRKVRLLSLLLCILLLSFAACTPDNGIIDTDGTDGSESNMISDNSENYEDSESESPSGTVIETESANGSGSETDETETEPDIFDIIYANGAELEGAGPSFADGAFALETHDINENAAIVKTAEEMLAILANPDNTTEKGAQKVYKVTEPLTLAANTSYDGDFLTLIAECGIFIEGSDKITVEELIIKSSVTIKDAKNITFSKVDIQSLETALSADKKSSEIEILDSIISAKETAITTEADEFFVLGCRISADKAILSDCDELEVQHSYIEASTLGISAKGDYCTVKNNAIESNNPKSVGISFEKGSYNGLIALNSIKVIQDSIKITEGFNCVVILNSAICVTSESNTNIYVVKNSLGGAIALRENQYLLCDDNSFLSDGLEHPIINTNNTEYNGNGLHDLSVRPEQGANEELLPHTNKDLFIEMDRETRVRDISLKKKHKYNEYILTLAENGGTVIIPPGVYSVTETLELSAKHSGATIYAFGVYQEKKALPTGSATPDKAVYDSMGKLVEITGDNISIHGLTFGYDFQSAGQVYVLEKYRENGKYYVRTVTSAGYYDGFGYGDTKWFAGQATAIKGDQLFGWRIRFSYKYVRRDSDGTMILELTEGSRIFSMIEPGDIFGCRLEGDNNFSISLRGADTLLKDCVLYGYSAALAVYAGGENAKGIRLERFHNTVHSAPIIDKETYDRYKALEKKYGMVSDGKDPVAEGAQGLEVYIDAERRYRGGLPRLGSVDGTHVVGAAEGLRLTSCIFEQMVDDGSNHRSNSSRIAGLYDNGDGTTTIYYKGSVAKTYYDMNTSAGVQNATPTKTSNFRKGDTIFAYASNGHVLIETAVLNDAVYAQDLPDDLHLFHIDADNDCICDQSGCGERLCFDNVNNATNAVGFDCKCDICGDAVHTDYNANVLVDGKGNGICKGCKITLTDTDQNGLNDSDNALIIRDMASDISYDPSSSSLRFKMHAVKGTTPYLITYTTQIFAVKVNTADLDLAALEGYDLCDNDYFMNDKIICDNISLNSSGFHFDNVLYRNYHCRGILPKTVNSTVKNCTFLNVACAGLLMSAEDSWGESTVPRNIVIENCLFDNTGHAYDKPTDLTYAPIAISGLGELSSEENVLSKETLPCSGIKIIGNKFVNMNNNYIITICAARDIIIRGNIFIGRKTEYTRTKAIYISGCLNIELSDNVYEGFDDRLLDQIIFAQNYSDLHGSDLEGTSIPSEKN